MYRKNARFKDTITENKFLAVCVIKAIEQIVFFMSCMYMD